MADDEVLLRKTDRVKQIYADFLLKLKKIEDEERSLAHHVFRSMDEKRIAEIRRRINDLSTETYGDKKKK